MTNPFLGWLRKGASLSLALVLAACAAPGGQQREDAAPPFRDATMQVTEAERAITLGTSTKAEVKAALGTANVVSFASGYEVWVYRAAGAEFVLLFAPSGIVKKTRIRPKSA